MNGREKSDPAIVAAKPPNEAGQPAEEPGITGDYGDSLIKTGLRG